MNENTSHPLSFWEKDAFLPAFDFVVIGAGIVGLNAALHLKGLRPKAKVAVLERSILPLGASTRNAGFACIGSMTELLHDLQQTSPDDLWQLVEKRYLGLQKMSIRLGEDRIQYHQFGGYELFREEDDELFEQCRDLMTEFNQHLKPITGLDQTFVQADHHLSSAGFDQVRHLLLNKAEGQLHPGFMMKNLLQLCREADISILHGVNIHKIHPEGSFVELENSMGWPILTRHLIVATNGFARQLLPELNIQPARNQVLITEPIRDLKIKACYHYHQGYYYFRNVQNRILLGGGRHLDAAGETTVELNTTPLIRKSLQKLLSEVILPGKKVAIDQWWSGILGVGDQKSPILKNIHPHVTVAVRLGGMGVAIGTLVGEEAAEMAVQS